MFKGGVISKEVRERGKAENTSFEVPTVYLHIHERISP